jgi:arsenate reductase
MLVYHNPSCSKSRGTLEILADKGVEHDVVEYLKAPPDRAALERILDAVADAPAELVRKDGRFDELGLTASDYTTREAVIELLLEHEGLKWSPSQAPAPATTVGKAAVAAELMQRPVVFWGERAVIARPSEKVLELLD